MNAIETFARILFMVLLFAMVEGCATSTLQSGAQHSPETLATDLEDARVLYELGKFDAAEHKLERVLRKDPHHPAALHLLALAGQGRHRRASGQERPWGYHPTIPPQPIYR